MRLVRHTAQPTCWRFPRTSDTLASVCLVLFALGVHAEFPVVLAANRDEFFARPTLTMARWDGDRGIVAGRDGVGNGTWFGVDGERRIAVVTNYREPGTVVAPDAPSRGQLALDFLQGDRDPERYLHELQTRAARYAPFNLLVGELPDLWYLSNRQGAIHRCAPGVHGLSNHLLDTPWPKVAKGRQRLAEALQTNASQRLPVDDTAHELSTRLLGLLGDTTRFPDELLPTTGVSLDWERALSPIRIVTPDYGTRSSTVLLFARDGKVTVVERTLGVGGQLPGERVFTLESA